MSDRTSGVIVPENKLDSLVMGWKKGRVFLILLYWCILFQY